MTDLANAIAAEVAAVRGWSLPAVIVDNGEGYRNGDRLCARSLSDALHYNLMDKVVGMNPVAKRVLEAAEYEATASSRREFPACD